jgi:Protein of unknown function (DUF2961).
MKITPAFLVLLLAFGVGCKNNPEKKNSTITFTRLLNEMSDRDALTRYPDPSFRLCQSSSWDRTEKNKQDKTTWFANKDYNYYLRVDSSRGRKEYVIMDAKGPGAITRWWIPQEKFLSHRIVRIYLDENPLPVIEENYEKFINGESFVKWPFAFTSSDEKDSAYQYDMPVGFAKQMGADFYLPLPFAKACKVTLDDSVFYYSIDYRMYGKGTKVKSFLKEDITEDAALIESTGKKLLAENSSTAFVGQKAESILKNQKMEIDLPAGENAINDIHLKINSSNNKQMNRAAVLEIEIDGKKTVWVPVAEFFGGGVYARPVKNANIQMTDDGWMISNWVMPYKNTAKVILRNYGEEPVTAILKVGIKEYKWDDRSMYFNAAWHEEAPLNTPPAKDWNYVEINGKGSYVGDVLTVHSVPKNWWGEGDEKIYIDGESFPSQLGTGLEDYYGFAWGIANFFNSPFISIPSRDARSKEDWSGYNTVARMRLLDDIIFSRSLKVDMEAMNPEPGVSFAVCCFWYSMPSSGSNIKPDETTIQRKLMDFKPVVRNKTPGELFPDPVGNSLLLTHQNGNIRFAGEQLDLLSWRDKNVPKPLDADGDNVLGSAGYILFGEKILNMQGFHNVAGSSLPSFINSITTLPVKTGFRNAALFLPEHKSDYHITGVIQTTGDSAKRGLVSFVIGEKAPPSFRLSIMLDNSESFSKVGKFLWVTQSGKETSDKVYLAASNRIPDWYFFDLNNIKRGDTITISGMTERRSDIFSVGGLTFDIKNRP